MIVVNGKKLSQKEVNTLYVEACNRLDLAKIAYALNVLNADVNAKDPLGYLPAIAYVGRKTGVGEEERRHIDAIMRTLIAKGADIDFKYGDKHVANKSKPYFLHLIASNSTFSDDLVFKMVDMLNQKYKNKDFLREYLDFKPQTKSHEPISSISTIIQKQRPELYTKLQNQGLVKKEEIKR